MRIVPASVIKDGGVVYQPAVEYEVDDEVGRRFVILGWAASPDYTPAGVAPPPAVADIDVHSVSHDSTATEV